MMKSIPGARILTGLALAAGLMIGCTDFLGSEKTAETAEVTGDESGTLALSIKDDSSCREQWRVILAARTAGKPDTIGEAIFLGACVKEVKITKDTPKPVIPPGLMPDSGTRCKWIATQIEGGRDSLTVSYKKYCPEDCKTLAAKDAAHHDKLCRDPGVIPPKTRDTVLIRPIPDSLRPKIEPADDTCRMLREKLAGLKEGDPARAEVEKLALARCGKVPPVVDLPADECKLMMERLMKMDPATPEYAKAKEAWAAKCGGIVPPKPDPIEDTCAMLRRKLEATKPGEPGRAELEKLVLAHCGKLPVDPPADDCKLMLERLMKMDASTPEYAKAKEAWAAKCGGIVPPKPDPIEDTCAMLRRKLEATKPGEPGRAELEKTLLAHCGKIPPVIVPVDECKLMYERLMKMDPAAPEYAKAKEAWYAKCGGVVPPKDTVIIKPVPSTRDSICMDLKLRLSKATDEKQRAELEAAYKAKCMEPVPVKDPVVKDPVIVPVSDCDAIRKKMSLVDPASADYAYLAGYLKEKCLEAPAVK